ncbi:hypothetical protein DSS3P8_178 [Roseobacter phage DSS3P8]|nr:hypothetical protein DSS3P8_178 [Roseobacter phage DSS3P8]
MKIDFENNYYIDGRKIDVEHASVRAEWTQRRAVAVTMQESKSKGGWPEIYLKGFQKDYSGELRGERFFPGNGGMGVTVTGVTTMDVMCALLEHPDTLRFLAKGVDYIRHTGKTQDGEPISVHPVQTEFRE